MTLDRTWYGVGAALSYVRKVGSWLGLAFAAEVIMQPRWVFITSDTGDAFSAPRFAGTFGIYPVFYFN